MLIQAKVIAYSVFLWVSMDIIYQTAEIGWMAYLLSFKRLLKKAAFARLLFIDGLGIANE